MYVNRKYSPWQFDPEFSALMKQIATISIVDSARLFALWQFSHHAKTLHGSVAEVGVYRGGSLYLMSRTFDRSTDIFGFDTFEGMPNTIVAVDSHKAGDFKDTALDDVQNLIGAEHKNVHLIKGLFPKSAVIMLDDVKFSLVHIDCDIYLSVHDCCMFFYPKMVPGGIMVFDDYGWETCKGAKFAADEFFQPRPENIIYLSTGQSFVIKR